MKLITSMLGLLVAAITVSFAVANRQFVTVSFWPTPLEVNLPLAALIVILGTVAFLLGWLFAWLCYVPKNIILKKDNKEIKKQLEILESKNKELQNQPDEKNTTSKNTSVFFS